MKVIRKFKNLKKMTKQDDSYVNASPQERISVIWEITAELWSLKDRQFAEQRLQRNVTKLIKNKESTGRERDKLDAQYLRQNN